MKIKMNRKEQELLINHHQLKQNYVKYVYINNIVLLLFDIIINIADNLKIKYLFKSLVITDNQFQLTFISF